MLLLADLFTWLDSRSDLATPSSCDPLVRPEGFADLCASPVRAARRQYEQAKTGMWRDFGYNIAIDVVDSALG
jgi:hypothetical protein